MPDSPGEAARFLTRNAVDALPEGELGRQLAEDRPLRVKLGVDPTTPDIHLGHTVVLRKLREFQDLGHTVVLIIGDYTARVGDPSGRSSVTAGRWTRRRSTRNAATYQEQAFKVLDRERTEVRRNGEWLDMADGGPVQARAHVHGRPAARARRLRQALRGRAPDLDPRAALPAAPGLRLGGRSADVELGGTDQKFNLLLARDIQQAYGVPRRSPILTMPILPGIDGEQKMSKSLGNYVGVAEPPEEVFGKLMRVPDAAMPTYYELLMDDPLDPLAVPARPEARARARPDGAPPRRRGGRGGAEARFDRLHVEHGVPDDVEEHAFSRRQRHGPHAALLADAFGLSRSEGRRLLAQAGVRLDGEPSTRLAWTCRPIALDGAVLQVGRRRFKRLIQRSQIGSAVVAEASAVLHCSVALGAGRNHRRSGRTVFENSAVRATERSRPGSTPELGAHNDFDRRGAEAEGPEQNPSSPARSAMCTRGSARATALGPAREDLTTLRSDSGPEPSPGGDWIDTTPDFHGEFDPGSGRTLAACLTHASGATNQASAWGRAANG